MIPPVEEFKKETLGATYEHINKLIKDKDFDPEGCIKYNENLGPLEKKFQGIVIDTFKLKEGVINCLLSGDPHLVKRVLKCDWFFEDALPPKSYEEEIFPNVSISTRCKIINRLSRNIKNEKDAEELFQFTIKNYGRKYAEMILARCSSEFVSDYIIKCKPKFNHQNSERNLINICLRFPDIGISYLEREMGEGFRGSIIRSTKLIRYLTRNYPHVLLSVLDKYRSEMFSFRFGRKSSKALHPRFMKLASETPVLVLAERTEMSVMFKRLTYEEKFTFFTLIARQSGRGPEYASLNDWFHASYRMKNFLELLPPSDRPPMVEAVFFELYNENFLDHPEVWSLPFIELFPLDYRNRLVEILERRCGEAAVKDALQSECRDLEREPKDTFVYLMGFKRAFPLLTRMMRKMTTVIRRVILLEEMVWNCIINNDPEGLESVAKYIFVKHKNEDPRVLCNLILFNFMSAPKIMNSKVWDWMEKMAGLLTVRLNDSYISEIVLESYIGYRISNNVDAQAQVKKMVKLSVVPSQHSFILIRKMEKPYCRTLIMLCYKEIFSGDRDYAAEDIKDKLVLSLLMAINDFNNKRKRNRINVEDLPLLVEGIDKMIKRVGSFKKQHAFSTAILSNRFLRKKYANLLLDIYMKPKAYRYLIKFHPDCILRNFERILTEVLECSEGRKLDQMFVSRSQIEFFGCRAKVEEAIRERFKRSPSSSLKLRALKAYSHVTTLENFKELTEQYVPLDEQVSFDSSKREFYEIQVNVPGLIRNVKPVCKNFDFVAKYLKKDFLRLVLPSFFAVCHNSPVSSIIPVLQHHLETNADASVKKILLCCILDLLPKVERFQYCQTMWENEKHSSLGEFVFNAISRSWRKDQSREFFEMVKKCIREADEATINGRLKMKMIPTHLVGEYTMALWEFTENNKGKHFSVTCKKEIVRHFDGKNISNLSEEFCQKLLTMYLFDPDAEVGVENFCCHYIFYHSSRPMDQKINFFLELLRERRNKFSSVTYFINRLKNFAKINPGAVLFVIDELLIEWPSLYGACKMFKEYLLLNYMKGYITALKTSHTRNELFGAAVGKEIRKVVNAVPNFECFVEIFKSTLTDFIKDFRLQDVMYLVIDNFLGSSFTDAEGVIAIQMIPMIAFEIHRMKISDAQLKSAYLVEILVKYTAVFQKLLDNMNDVLKIHMNLHRDSIRE